MSDTPPGSLISERTIEELCRRAGDTPVGAFVEVGVYRGGSGWWLAKKAQEQGRACYLYDTFTGIPYKGPLDSHVVGDFGDTDYETVKAAIPYAQVIKGVFPASAVEMGPVAAVHLDCDQYQSIVDSVNFLLPLMPKGGLLWFDDYACLPGATKAVKDLFGENYKISDVGGKAYVVL